MNKFRVVSEQNRKWRIDKQRRFLFGLIRFWVIDISFPYIYYATAKEAVRAIKDGYPQGKLKIYKGRSKVLHFKRDK